MIKYKSGQVVVNFTINLSNDGYLLGCSIVYDPIGNSYYNIFIGRELVGTSLTIKQGKKILKEEIIETYNNEIDILIRKQVEYNKRKEYVLDNYHDLSTTLIDRLEEE